MVQVKQTSNIKMKVFSFGLGFVWMNQGGENANNFTEKLKDWLCAGGRIGILILTLVTDFSFNVHLVFSIHLWAHSLICRVLLTIFEFQILLFINLVINSTLYRILFAFYVKQLKMKLIFYNVVKCICIVDSIIGLFCTLTNLFKLSILLVSTNKSIVKNL